MSTRKKAPKLEDILSKETGILGVNENSETVPEKKIKVKNTKTNVSKAEKKETKTVVSDISVKDNKVARAHTSVYMPLAVKEKLEEIQFSERKTGVNQNDLILEGIDMLFKKRGFPSIKALVENENT